MLTSSTTRDQNKAVAKEDLLTLGREVLEIEAEALKALANNLDDSFIKACEYLLNCNGRVIVIGMGKSGHIGKKIAATLASTGTPAFAVHPGEASHGDLGMITKDDVAILISYSGNTDELTSLIPSLKRLGIPLISMTGKPESLLSQNATVNLDIRIKQEACPLGLAPTASTTATLAMGDALAVALLSANNFTKDDFARSHPAGSLGRRLLLRVSDIMHKGDRLPYVRSGEKLSLALLEMSEKSLGMLAVTDEYMRVLGVFTDGDLRRTINKGIDIHETTIDDVMTSQCTTTTAETLAASALSLMESKNINGLLVTDEKERLVGAFNMLDMLRAKVI